MFDIICMSCNRPANQMQLSNLKINRYCKLNINGILGLEAPSVVDDVLQPGRKLVAAGYALYGSATMMVLSTGQGVNGFIYDPSIGEFVLTKPNIVMKPAGRQYSVNESYSASWDRRILDFINSKKQGNNPIPQR